MDIISRKDARDLGQIRFYTGRLCKYGHDAERFVSSGACLDCLKRTTPKLKRRYVRRFPQLQRYDGVLYVLAGTSDENKAELQSYLQKCFIHWLQHKALSDPKIANTLPFIREFLEEFK